MGNIKVSINPKALDESAFLESVMRAENRDRSQIEGIQKRMRELDKRFPEYSKNFRVELTKRTFSNQKNT
tara:strand:- start:191 stop:400 length:210 start_codon:yes stop_codon:yes gene_type:complete